MNKIGLFYGSTSGRAESIADEVEFILRDDVVIHNVAKGIEELNSFDNFIFVIPTYGIGELQEDWENIFNDFKKLDLTNKVIGLIGLGNQTTFGESFLGGLEDMYKAILNQNGKVVGLTSTNGYHFEECEAIVDGKFMGLALDEDNQEDMTPDRIFDWLEEIKPLFN